MSYTPRYPQYGNSVTSLSGLSDADYIARGLLGEAGYSDQHNDKKGVAKVFYNRKISNRTTEFGSTYRDIAYKALDALKNPTNRMLNPRSNDLDSESFDECVDAVLNLLNGNISNLNVDIKDYKFYVDDSLLSDFKAVKVYMEDGSIQWVYYFKDKLLEAKYISFERLNFFDYYGY